MPVHPHGILVACIPKSNYATLNPNPNAGAADPFRRILSTFFVHWLGTLKIRDTLHHKLRCAQSLLAATAVSQLYLYELQLHRGPWPEDALALRPDHLERHMPLAARQHNSPSAQMPVPLDLDVAVVESRCG
eukprot:354141-Chlamydomonas_euryale.AAC.11